MDNDYKNWGSGLQAGMAHGYLNTYGHECPTAEELLKRDIANLEAAIARHEENLKRLPILKAALAALQGK